MDISTDEAVKDELFRESQTFRDLVTQHKTYEDRLTVLSGLNFPNGDEQIEEVTIKKKKLSIKDEIYSMISEYSKAH